MNIVPSLWVSTYYCILGWHLVITKTKEKLFINFVISRHQLQFNYYIVRDVLKNFPQKIFFSRGRTVKNDWMITHQSFITFSKTHSLTHGKPRVSYTWSKKKKRSCDGLSQASRVTSRCAVMERRHIRDTLQL